MTDASTPDDEIISSYLDGEASLSDVSRVEADANWVHRASELRAAAELSADPVSPLDSSVIDQMVSVAIDAADIPANVTDLSAARRSRMPQILTAAAAVVMLALAVPIIRSIGDSSGDSNSAATSFTTSDAAADVDADATTATDGEDQELTESALAPAAVSPTATASSLDAGSATSARMADTASLDLLPIRLPDVVDVPALHEYLAALFTATAKDSAPSSADTLQPDISEQCAEVLAEFASRSAVPSSLPTPDSFTDIGLVSVNGTINLVELIQLGPGQAIALLVDATECSSVSQINVAP